VKAALHRERALETAKPDKPQQATQAGAPADPLVDVAALDLDPLSKRAPWYVRHSRRLLIGGIAAAVLLAVAFSYALWRTFGWTPLDEIRIAAPRPTTQDAAPPARREVRVESVAKPPPPAPERAPAKREPRVETAAKPAPAAPRGAESTPVPVYAGRGVTHTRPQSSESTPQPQREQPRTLQRPSAPPPGCTEAVAALSLCPSAPPGTGR